MCDEWFSTIELPITLEQFHRLPRHAAYKYEYFGGRAWLSPRPRHYHALLDLRPFREAPVVPPPEPVTLRRLEKGDWDELARLFAVAFERVQPFASLDDEARLGAARTCLERTRTGGDGPLIWQASFCAVGQAERRPLGAILLTLVPEGDLAEWGSCQWKEPPPPDAVALRLGRPHLTWVFVGQWHAGHGVGTALLSAAARELLALGYHDLASTFMCGNDSSMLWHWRNGFQLVAHPSSWRLLHERLQRNTEDEPPGRWEADWPL